MTSNNSFENGIEKQTPLNYYYLTLHVVKHDHQS